MSEKRPRKHGIEVAALLISAAEFLVLLGLWMLFVSLLQLNELVAGIAAALIGAVADAVVKATDFARFRPRLKHLLLILTEPWYVISGTASIFWALAKRIAGQPSEGELKVIPYDAGGDDSDSSARRALTVAYTTIPPNFIVIGIDRERNYLMVHQVSPTGTPWITKQLGALK